MYKLRNYLKYTCASVLLGLWQVEVVLAVLVLREQMVCQRDAYRAAGLRRARLDFRVRWVNYGVAAGPWRRFHSVGKVLGLRGK